MTREEGLKQIEETQWERNGGILEMRVNTADGWTVLAWLSMRPVYCDRGHVQLNIEGPLQLDHADSFPRYFFSFEEADEHARKFLKWRIWKYRTVSYGEIRKSFGAPAEQKPQVNQQLGLPSEHKLEIEHRHSDWGPDAGGYAVLRFDGEWIGRIDGREVADQLIAYVKSLEARAAEEQAHGEQQA